MNDITFKIITELEIDYYQIKNDFKNIKGFFFLGHLKNDMTLKIIIELKIDYYWITNILKITLFFK